VDTNHTRYERTGGYPAVFITDTMLGETGRLLASFAEREPSEGIVYWFGLEQASRAIVTTLVVPDADTATGAVRTSALANARALSVAVGTPLVLLGQAHSHPGCNVSHSSVDDQDTFARFDGSLSLVVPYFGWYGVKLPECGLYRHVEGRFRRIAPERLGEHLVVLPGSADCRRLGHTETTESIR
jgi:hypothetical protein